MHTDRKRVNSPQLPNEKAKKCLTSTGTASTLNSRAGWWSGIPLICENTAILTVIPV